VRSAPSLAFVTGRGVLPSAAVHNVRQVPPLITREEALHLGELEEPEQIEALVQRAWEARVERFADSTDMCSLVNAKSGGCAEDCGFCAQSRFAEAETPMHALMDPEQVLEHARAAEAAGAHRFCMVTQGQGLSKRDFEKYLEGVRLVSEHTNLKRCASIGHMSTARATALKEAGIQRVHHNVETASSYYDEVSTTVRYEGRLRTIQAVREAGLETCVGGILNLGETREQRVEMAFELAAIDPTSVPINLLNPRPGTKFGDRELIDPWEAVKWIAIFRLILPEALFRLCGGRVENLGELQPLAVKAGLNGVMMGNFLTTLGNEPEQDRAMFEEHGLNVGRQPDNAANPRPDNRSGWLRGETPDVVEELLDDRALRSASGRAATPRDGGMAGLNEEAGLKIRLWDPSTQLRYRAKRSVPPRPDGAPNRASNQQRSSDRVSGPRPSDTAPSPVPAGWGD
jgi:biotin synthase